MPVTSIVVYYSRDVYDLSQFIQKVDNLGDVTSTCCPNIHSAKRFIQQLFGLRNGDDVCAFLSLSLSLSVHCVAGSLTHWLKVQNFELGRVHLT